MNWISKVEVEDWEEEEEEDWEEEEEGDREEEEESWINLAYSLTGSSPLQTAICNLSNWPLGPCIRLISPVTTVDHRPLFWRVIFSNV